MKETEDYFVNPNSLLNKATNKAGLHSLVVARLYEILSLKFPAVSVTTDGKHNYAVCLNVPRIWWWRNRAAREEIEEICFDFIKSLDNEIASLAVKRTCVAGCSAS